MSNSMRYYRVKIASNEPNMVKLTNSAKFCSSGESLSVVMATIKWNSIYHMSGNKIYSNIERFCV